MGNIFSRTLPPSRQSPAREERRDSSLDPPGTRVDHVDQEQATNQALPDTSKGPRTEISACSNVVYVGSVTGHVVNIQGSTAPNSQQSSRPLLGTLAQETLELRISEAEENFVPTESFKQVRSTLDQFGHVTICGASGERKTTMALMIANDYKNKGYDIVFVERTDTFDFNQCISSTRKFVLIVDDMFSTVGSSAEITQVKRLLQSLKSHIQDSSKRSKRSVKSMQGSEQNRDQEHDDSMEQKDIKVVFTSKTYNFKEAITMLEYERLSLLRDDSVVELTGKKACYYTKEEKIAIFERYRQTHFESAKEELEFLWKLDKMLFGFPLTCRLFFTFPNLADNAEDFFKHPLLYLKMELKYLLGLRNNTSAALILMVLCEGLIVLADLELKGSNQTMDKILLDVTDIVPSATRSGIATAARSLAGTFLYGRDVLSFTHSSVYDACAYAMYHFNQAFVLQYSTFDFLYERVKPETETRAPEHLHFIYLTASYFDVFATKLARGMSEGYFSKTVTHPTLKNDQLVELLFQKLKAEPDPVQLMHQKDMGKGLLYWAVLGHSPLLVRKIENEIDIKFEPNEVLESLDGCVENNDLVLFKLLLSKLDKEYDETLKNRLLLLSAEMESPEIAQHLVEDGAEINATDEDSQNYVHIACRMGESKMLSYRVLQTFITDQEQQAAIHAKDADGRTPAMIAALSGSSACFEFLRDASNLDIEDNYGDSTIHLACAGGNTDIVQQVLTSSNINSKGQYRWTPVLNAAYYGHQSVFEFLVSENADLTVTDDSGNSLLHLACLGGSAEIVQQVLTPSCINSRGMYGWTPVMYAAVNGHQKVFDFLVSNDADLTLVSDTRDSVLHLACQGGNRDIVDHVLTPSNVNSRGNLGWTPLMYAAVNGHQRVFELLVSNDADLTLVPETGDTLLNLACKGKNNEIIQHVLTPDEVPDTFLTDVHVEAVGIVGGQ